MRIVSPDYEPWQRDVVAIAEDIINLVVSGQSIDKVRDFAVDAMLDWEAKYETC